MVEPGDHPPVVALMDQVDHRRRQTGRVVVDQAQPFRPHAQGDFTRAGTTIGTWAGGKLSKSKGTLAMIFAAFVVLIGVYVTWQGLAGFL